MSGWEALGRFLEIDPRDPGCGETMDVLHVYAELVLAGTDPRDRFPGIVAHLRLCSPCSEDLEGLLAAAG